MGASSIRRLDIAAVAAEEPIDDEQVDFMKFNEVVDSHLAAGQC
jgi:hypothetical protein